MQEISLSLEATHPPTSECSLDTPISYLGCRHCTTYLHLHHPPQTPFVLVSSAGQNYSGIPCTATYVTNIHFYQVLKVVMCIVLEVSEGKNYPTTIQSV